MSSSCCSSETIPPERPSLNPCAAAVEAPVQTLRAAVQRYGTPLYAYDLGRIRAQIAKLRDHLPAAIQILYSLKANASLGLCTVLAESGLGADVASAGELVTALEAGFPSQRIFITGPDKSTTVIAQQTHRGREAVVVDGGVHQRGDLCGLGLRSQAFPPVVLNDSATRSLPERRLLAARDVLGCLSLPSDILAEASLLPALSVGDVLAFPNAGAYGLLASPALFHGHPVPAEVAFEGTSLELLRVRQIAKNILEGQVRNLPGGNIRIP